MKIRIAKIKGIEISIHYTWIIAFLLFTWSLASGYFRPLFPGWEGISYWLAGIGATLLLFAGVLIHELAHSLVATERGTPVKEITLFIFGGVAQITEEPKDPTSELYISIAGPIASLVLAGIFYLLTYFVKAQIPSAIFSYLFLVNIVLAIFNLLPAFPLDGGRVLRAILWRSKKNYYQATRIASISGSVFGYILIFLGFLSMIMGNFVGGLWWLIMGWFLQSSAESGLQQLMIQRALSGLTVSSIMTSDIRSVPPNITLEELAQEYFIGLQQSAFLVSWGDEVLGIVTLADLKKVPKEKWTQETVRQIMTPLEKLATVSPQESALEALKKMGEINVGRLPVIENGRIVGLVTRQNLLDAIRIRSEVGI